MKTKYTVSERLEKHSTPEPNSGCFIWIGHTSPDGYGQIKIRPSDNRHGDKYSKYGAHRVAYEEFYDTAIHDKLVIDHKCRVRCCINPNHLEVVSNKENTLRSELTWASINRAKTHCPKGHPYSGENLSETKGGRKCRACVRFAVAKYRMANRKKIAVHQKEYMARKRAICR